VIPLLRIPHRVAVPALVALFVVCGFVSLSLESATFDETAHVGAGVSYLETGDFRLNPEHPPLVKLIAAAPLELLGRGGGDYASPLWTGTPLSDEDPRRSHAYQWGIGFEFLNGPHESSSRRDPAARLTPARCAILALGVLLALVVYAWARELHGKPAGLFALAVAVTCPTIAAHARLVTTDLPAALGFAATTWLAWRWLASPSWRRAASAGAALGAAALLKFSCALLAPVVVALAAIAVASGRVEWKRAVAGIALIAAVAYVSIWAGYGLRFNASRDPGYVLEWNDLAASTPLPPSIAFAREHRLLPEAYLYGLAYAKAESDRLAFLDGEQSLAGWYRYFPEAFLLKTPLAFTALALWVIGAALIRTRGKSFDGWCVALPPLVLAATAIQSRFNIGHRHLTPVYPFLCVAIAPAAAWIAERGTRAAAVAVLTLSCFVSFALATPRYLSYFNAAAGGPRGGAKHLVDSNLDWGAGPSPPEALDGRPRRSRSRPRVLRHGGPACVRHRFPQGRALHGFLPGHARRAGRSPDTTWRPASRSSKGCISTPIAPSRRKSSGRGFVARSKVDEYLGDSRSRRLRGLPLVHVADWMAERRLIDADQRRAAEDVIPASWLRRVRDTQTPVGWAGDSIAIYEIGE
jgi:hypothetical protein